MRDLTEGPSHQKQLFCLVKNLYDEHESELARTHGVTATISRSQYY